MYPQYNDLIKNKIAAEKNQRHAEWEFYTEWSEVTELI
jgi:hypothetical protein